MLEWYEAYADYEDIAARLEELVAYVAAATSGYDGPIDFSPPVEARSRCATRSGRRPASTSCPPRPRRAAAARAAGSGPDSLAQRVDDLLSKHVEPSSQDPTFILDYPKELSPFAKDHRSEPGLVERFECFAGGMEFANAFTELNDPDEQRARFEQQARRRGGGRRGDPALRRGLRRAP